jgi:spermidine/putrescine transport system permease protein
VFTWLYLAWAIVPVVIAIGFSFNAGRSRSVWQGFSFEWWIGHPDLSLLHDPTLTSAIRQSLILAVATMAIATPIGIALALGLARWRGRGAGSANFLMLLPLATPEIVLVTGIFFTLVFLYPFPNPGTFGQIVGHVTWSIPYVVVVLRGRIFGIGSELEEAAMDLGAPPLDALRRVMLPVLAPAIFAAFMIVFALSIDDFVTSQFLATVRDRDPDARDLPRCDRSRIRGHARTRQATGSSGGGFGRRGLPDLGAYRRTGRSLNKWPQSMHFMFRRAPGPACVNGCVCADPHEGHTGRSGGRGGRSARSTEVTHQVSRSPCFERRSLVAHRLGRVMQGPE